MFDKSRMHLVIIKISGKIIDFNIQQIYKDTWNIRIFKSFNNVNLCVKF